MAKTSVTAGRGSKFDPHIRTKAKSKPTVKQAATSEASDQTVVTVGEEDREKASETEAKETEHPREERGGESAARNVKQNGKEDGENSELQAKTQDRGGREENGES